MLSKLDGYKTYAVGGALIAIEIGKYILGQGFDLDSLLTGIAIMTGRQAISKVEAKVKAGR